MKDRELFWWRWLIIVSVGVMLFGFSMVVAPSLTKQFFSLLLFSSPEAIGGFGEPAVSYVGLVHGVLGAVMFGWGVMLLLVLLGPFRRGSHEAWLTLSISLAAWFIPDTIFSLWSGYWQNAVFNTALVFLFAIPLAATYRVSNKRKT